MRRLTRSYTLGVMRHPDGGEDGGSGVFARAALSLTAWAERWVPDAFVFALGVTILVFALGVGLERAPASTLLESWGKGCWELVPCAMQMALIIVTGYVLATSRPVARAITRLARLPRTRARGDGDGRALRDGHVVDQLGSSA